MIDAEFDDAMLSLVFVVALSILIVRPCDVLGAINTASWVLAAILVAILARNCSGVWR